MVKIASVKNHQKKIIFDRTSILFTPSHEIMILGGHITRSLYFCVNGHWAWWLKCWNCTLGLFKIKWFFPLRQHILFEVNESIWTKPYTYMILGVNMVPHSASMYEQTYVYLYHTKKTHNQKDRKKHKTKRPHLEGKNKRNQASWGRFNLFQSLWPVTCRYGVARAAASLGRWEWAVSLSLCTGNTYPHTATFCFLSPLFVAGMSDACLIIFVVVFFFSLF